jgi:hypothetical protein
VNLRVLDLRGCTMSVQANKRLFGEGKPFPHLVSLNMDRTYGNLGALAKSARFPRLRALSFDQNSMHEDQIRALAGSPVLAGLRSLSLQGMIEPPMQGGEFGTLNFQLGPDVAQMLARSKNAAGLRRLDLGYQGIGDKGAQALAKSKHLGGLTTLKLWHNQIGRGGAEALLTSKLLDRLSRLDVRSNPLPAAACRALRKRLGYDVTYGQGPAPRPRWDPLDEEFPGDDEEMEEVEE